MIEEHQDFIPIPPEEESLPVGKLVLAAAIAVALFTVAVFIAWRMSLAGAASTIPADLGRGEVGMVHQRPFSLEKDSRTLQSDARQHLTQYGWVDREQRLIHIPVDRAIEHLVEAQRKEALR